MAFWEAAFGGSSGGQVRLRVQADVIAQEIGNNRSLVRYNAWIERVGSTSVYSGYTTYGNTNINGYNPGRSLGSYNFGTTARYNLAVNEDYWVYHDGAGNANPYFGANFNLDNSPYITSAATGGNMWLPSIPRYANISSWSLSSVTEKSMLVSVNVDRTSDLVDYSLNGGAWTRGYTGAFGSTSFTINNLVFNTAYNVKVRVRAQDSGLYTESGLKSATTSPVTITSLTVPSATDTTLELKAITSHTADQLQYRISPSATWITGFSGDFTTKQITITGLASNTTFTVESRVRHKDSQQYTPVVSTTGTTEYPTPLQPSNLDPSGGEGVGTLTPTLSWTYNATSTDFQSAYQVIVYRASDSVVMWDSTKTTGGISSVTVPGSTLAWNVQYQWKVKTWSGTDIEGTYSSLALFKTSEVPTVSITSPTALQSVTTDAPTVEWTYTDPESTAQASYTITVESISTTGLTTGELVYQDTQSGTAVSYTLPAGYLANGGRYIVKVSATDGDGVVGTSTVREFTVLYIGPPAPTVTVELSDDKLFTRVSAEPNNPVADSYEADYYRFYKREVGTTQWNYLGQVSNISSSIDTFDQITGWAASGVGSGPTIETTRRQGDSSVSFATSSSGTGTFVKTVSNVVDDSQKLRLWAYKAAGTPITSIEVRYGEDSTHYYSKTFLNVDLPDNTWTSLEWVINTGTAVGITDLSTIDYIAINLVGSAAITAGSLLLDDFRVVNKDSLFVLDYELANKKTYEYTASAVNLDQNLEGAYADATDPLLIRYSPFSNTFLIPIDAKSKSVVGFADVRSNGSLQDKTPTEYHHPIGSRYPIAYSSGVQQYKTGDMTIQFDSQCYGGDGYEGVEALLDIKNMKPIMLRTYWGSIYYISIDGNVSFDRIIDGGWSAGFTYTEVGA